MTLEEPKTHKAEILHTILQKGEVSLMDFPHLSGYRTRLSELRRVLPCSALKRELREGKSKFNNPFKYAAYILNDFHQRTVLKVYNEINTKD